MDGTPAWGSRENGLRLAGTGRAWDWERESSPGSESQTEFQGLGGWEDAPWLAGDGEESGAGGWGNGKLVSEPLNQINK